MKTAVIPFALLLFCQGALLGQTADLDVAAGRAALAAQNITNANGDFAAALGLAPNHETGNVFYAATRLLALPYQPAGSAFLNRLGVAATNRSIYHWTADLPIGAHGVPFAPTNMSGDEVVAYLRTNILGQIIGSAGNLALVTDTNFLLTLTSNETATAAVTLDYGDLLVLQAGLQAAESAVYTINPLNLDVQLTTLRAAVVSGTNTVQGFLAQFTNLLTYASTADLPAAKLALSNAMVLYLDASEFIRSRPTNVVRLFNIDPSMANEEASFRTTLTNALQSLNGPAALTEYPGVTLDLSNFFSGAESPREFVPPFTGNAFIDGTLPDTTFGGVVEGLSSYQIESVFGRLVDYPALPYLFTTIAGKAGARTSADGTNSGARFSTPASVATDASGNTYVADRYNCTIRKLTPVGTNWVSSTIAGTPGVTGSADGTNGAALFNQPLGVALDADGDVFVADTFNNTIRELRPVGISWVSSTIAGLAGVGGGGDGTNSAIQFVHPCSLAFDASSNLYVADSVNSTIRKLSKSGTNWVSSTIAGTAGIIGSADGTNGAIQFYGPFGLSVDGIGNVFVADAENSTVRKLTKVGAEWVSSTIAGLAGNYGSADGTNNASRFFSPFGVAADGSGDVYVADTANDTIRKLSPAGTNWVSSTIAGLAGIFGSADGTNSTARFAGPEDVAVVASGILLVADGDNDTIRKLTQSGTNWVSSTIAGSPGDPSVGDGTNDTIGFFNPIGVALDNSGNLFVADTLEQKIRKLTRVGTNWVSSTIAGVAGNSGTNDGTNGAIEFNDPVGIAVDGSGSVYVADWGNYTIRKLTPVGTNWASSTIAGQIGTYGATDGIGTNAQFFNPSGLAIDGLGNLYVADTANQTIRKLTPVGTNWVTTTIAGLAGHIGSEDGTNGAIRFIYPADVAVDASGNVYVADTDNSTVRKLTPVGTNWVSSTIAGRAGSGGAADGTRNARFSSPSGVAVDPSGRVYVTDGGNNTIRMITPTGTNWVVTTLGGSAEGAGSTDGVGSVARFSGPAGIAVDTNANIYIADSQNDTIREGVLLHAAPVLSIGGVRVSGNDLILEDITGAPGATYYVLESTDVTMPLSQWTRVATNVLGASGPFAITVANGFSATVSRRFYTLQAE